MIKCIKNVSVVNKMTTASKEKVYELKNYMYYMCNNTHNHLVEISYAVFAISSIVIVLQIT